MTTPVPPTYAQPPRALADPAADDQLARRAYVLASLGTTPKQVDVRYPALSTWRAAVAGRATAPADILCIGDSLTEGIGATTRAQRWVERLRDLLRTRYPTPGVAGGEGFIAASTWTASIPAWDWTYAGNWAQSGSYGYGQRNVLLQAGPAGAMTRTVSGTSVQVYYTRYTGGGVFGVYLDGSSTPAATVDTSAGATGVDDGGRSAVISLGTRGSHSVKISWVTGGNGAPVYIGGIMVYDQDEAAGIRLTEAGHSSSASSYWDQTLNVAIGSMTANTAASDPDLVIIGLGGNDMFQSYPPASFKASMQNLIAQVRTAKPGVAILVLMMYEIVGTYAYPFTDYAAKARELVTADAGLALLDLSACMPSTSTVNAGYGVLYDGLHPNDLGHDTIARRIADYLTGATPGPHAANHAIGGSDPLTPSAIGAAAGTAPTAKKTANYNANFGELVLADATNGPFTIFLPAAAGNDAKRVAVKKVDPTSNIVTVSAAAGSSDTVGSQGASSVPLRLGDQAATYQVSGTNYVIPHGYLGLPSLDARFVPVTVATAKGDLLVATGAGAITRLGAGTDGQALVADSTQAAGVKWAAAGGSSGMPELIPTAPQTGAAVTALVGRLTLVAPTAFQVVTAPAAVVGARFGVKRTVIYDSATQTQISPAAGESFVNTDSPAFVRTRDETLRFRCDTAGQWLLESGGMTSSGSTSYLVSTTDSRMTNARTPTAHAASHALGGSDPLVDGGLIIGGGPWDREVYGDLVSNGHRDDVTATLAMTASARTYVLLLGRVPAGRAITGLRLARTVAATATAGVVAQLYSSPTLSSTAWTQQASITPATAGTGVIQTAAAIAAQAADLWYALVLVQPGTVSVYPTWATSPVIPAAVSALVSQGSALVVAGSSATATAPAGGATLNPTTGWTQLVQKPWAALY